MSLAVKQLADAHPADRPFDDALITCIEDCLACFQACADACLAEPDIVSLIKCVRTDLDCSDVCAATATVLSRRTAVDLTVIRAAVELSRRLHRLRRGV
jgi:flavoprotein